MYQRDCAYTHENLLTLTPDDIVEFFNLKVYGSPNSATNAMPKYGRSTSLESCKKHINYFMPNCLICWDVQTLRGNLTRSITVNGLINQIKKGRSLKERKNISRKKAI